MREHLRSIPPSIRGVAKKDALRLPLTIRVGGGGLGSPKRARQRRETWVNEQQEWSQVADEHRYKKPPRQEKAGPKPAYEESGRIEWTEEIIENYNDRGDLGIILEFTGIGGLTKASFLRGRRYYGPDTTLFYSPISYKEKGTLLILATTGDIFELQVAAHKDVNIFFQKELLLPQLEITHNPASMDVQQRNGLVIVSYNRR